MSVGNKTEKEFEFENYEEFYEHHQFEPIPEKIATKVDEYVPRFGWALDQIRELDVKSLCDLGCLEGSFALTVAKQLGIEVTGVDLTKDGIDLAKSRAKTFGLPAEFYQGYAEDHLEDFIKRGKTFDCVTAFELLEHVQDPERFLALIDKVLAPGGHVLISTPAFESPLFGKDDEENKCHIRLYTTRDEDYEEENKYGNVRKATSITKQIGKDRIKSIGVHNELINVLYS